MLPWAAQVAKISLILVKTSSNVKPAGNSFIPNCMQITLGKLDHEYSVSGCPILLPGTMLDLGTGPFFALSKDPVRGGEIDYECTGGYGRLAIRN